MAQGRFSGRFHAVTLFVDISGFTSLATALMEHSTKGAEVIAMVLGTIFEPLVDIIYAQGGFVATFAGDAFTAIFPTDAPSASLPAQEIYHRAIIAAWQSNIFVKNNKEQKTPFGSFSFDIKISIADGAVDWEIWQSAESTEAEQPQRASYFFVGEAIERCFEIDALVPAGGIILTSDVYARLPAGKAIVNDFTPYCQLIGLADSVDHAQPAPLSPSMPTGVEHFFPSWLAQRELGGEFRQIVAIFINLMELPSGPAGEQFQQALFQYLAQYGGYLCSIGRFGHHDRACTLILFWGAPTSHENDVTRALRFVLDLRQAAPIPMRVGITYHLAYAGFIGSAQRTEYTCYGLYIALAARQMANAQQGEILLDDYTAVQASQDFHLVPHGQQKFKGFIDERPVYLLERVRDQRDDAYDRIPFIGRQRELAQLSAHLRLILQGNFGGVVIIQGEAGMGKSRLLREFRRMIESPVPLLNQHRPDLLKAADQVDAMLPVEDVHAALATMPTPTWFYCRSDEILRLSLNPFRYLLRHYFNQSSAEDLAYNQRNFAQKMEELLAATAEPTLVAELIRLRSVLAALIGLQHEESFYQQLDPALRLENAFAALKTLFKAESCRRPLIIQVEDVHWLDAESKLFVERVANNIKGYPLLLLLTERAPAATPIIPPSASPHITATPTANTIAEIENDQEEAIAATASPRTVLRLSPLSKESLSLLASRWLDGAITPSLLDLLQDQAKGNPFFAEEMLLYWQEQEFLQWGDEGWLLESDEETPYHEKPSSLSPDVRTILTARLDHLPPAVKTVVQTATVLGDEFQRPLLAYMLQLQQEIVPADGITLAEEAGIWHTINGSECRFYHTLLCDAAYAMQSRSNLEKLHQHAATAITELYQNDPQPHYGTLVYHYYKANDPRQECHYARLAGIDAADNHLNQDAIRYFDRALALTEPTALAERYELSLAREAVHQWLGSRHGQLEDILLQLTIAEAANQPQWQAEAILKRANYERTTGNYDAAIASSQEAIALAVPLNNNALQARAYYIWGRVLRQQGEFQIAHRQFQYALIRARNKKSPLLSAHCLHEIGHLYYVQGNYEEAASFYSQAEVIYQQADDQRGQVNCLLMFGAIRYGKGIFVEAEQLYQKALTITRTVGWLPGEASCLSNLGNTYFDVGDYATAGSYHLEALHLCREIGDREGEAVSLDTLGLIAQRQGNLDAAERYYVSALAIQQELGDQHGEAYTQNHLGYRWLTQLEVALAKECFQRALQIRQKIGEEGTALDSIAGIAYAQWQEGDLAAALSSILSILEQLEEDGTDGLEAPVQIYLICYQILQDVAEIQPSYARSAQSTLDTAYQLVQERAALITDTTLQQLFLEAVPANATVVALWTQQQEGSAEDAQI